MCFSVWWPQRSVLGAVTMPLFGKKKGDVSKHGDYKSKKDFSNGNGLLSSNGKVRKSSSSSATPSMDPPSAVSNTDEVFDRSSSYNDEMAQTKPKLVFHCQQAHGSPTACISGFTSVKELYTAISTAFEMEPSDVSACLCPCHVFYVGK